MKYTIPLLMGCISLCASGQLPEDFKFEKSNPDKRTPIIHQLARHEQCHGNQECIERLQNLAQTISITIHHGTVIVEQDNRKIIYHKDGSVTEG